MSRIRHSALPKLDQCPCFEGAPAGPAATRGIKIDAALRLWLQDDARGMEDLSLSDREAVQWAADTIRALAGEQDVETRETHLMMRTPGIEHTGTADVVCFNNAWVADLKTGQIRDYYAQMAAYAYALMEKLFVSEWTAHLIYCDQREVVTHKFTFEQAKDTVDRIIAFARDPYREPRACDYCGWCKLKNECPAVVKPVTNTLATVKEPQGSIVAIREQLLADPAKLGQFLEEAQIFTTELLTPLRDAAKEMLTVNEDAVPGWKLTQVKGREHFDNISIVRAAAATKCGLDSLVLAMGGKMSGKDYRAWCASLNHPVEESEARLSEGTTQLRRVKPSAKNKQIKEK